jgi:hypothetical protein
MWDGTGSGSAPSSTVIALRLARGVSMRMVDVIGDRVRRLRKDRDLTLIQLASSIDKPGR